MVGKEIGGLGSKYIDPIRNPVVGSPLDKSSVNFWNKELMDAVAEGVGVGIGEFWGAKIPFFPDAWGNDGWECR